MTKHRASPKQGLPAERTPARGVREQPAGEVGVRVAELAEQVRALANGGRPARADAPSIEPPLPREDERIAIEVRPPAAEAGGVDPLAEQRRRVLASVIETAELAAAEIRSGAQREATEIRLRADAAIGEADAALERYREAVAALTSETERIELSVAALREQAQLLEEERRAIDAALELLRRRSAR
jgi:hypothetical protein